MEVAVRSTMMDVPLTVTGIMRYGTALYGGREVVTCTGDGTRRHHAPPRGGGDHGAEPTGTDIELSLVGLGGA